MAKASVANSHPVRNRYAKPSASWRRTDGSVASRLSAVGRGTGRIAINGSRAPRYATPAPSSATCGEKAATSSPASAGPAACWASGRSIPSMPFAASSSSAGSSAGTTADHVG